MATIFKEIGIADNQRVFTNDSQSELALGAIRQYVDAFNADANKALGVFVEDQTTLRQERFLNAGTGEAPATGFEPLAKPEAIQANGYWDVAYPLQSHEQAVGGNRIGLAYMTAAEMQRNIDNVMSRDLNRRRKDILRLALQSSNVSFTDNIGSLTIRKLANADGTKYNPKIGTSADLESHDHYLASGYAAGSISDTNNPIVTMRDHLVEHWGRANDGYPIVVMVNPAQAVDSQLGGLTSLEEVQSQNVTFGDDQNYGNIAGVSLPGGAYAAGYGAYVQIWDWIPAGYMLAVHLGAGVPKMAKERVDPADTGLNPGLQLVLEQEDYPFKNMYWDDRFGYGVYNRLGAVAMQLTTGSWSDPTI